MKIFYCRKCRALDYAKEKCPKCGNAEIDEASMEFLAFNSSTIQRSTMPVLWTGIRSIEKIGWN